MKVPPVAFVATGHLVLLVSPGTRNVDMLDLIKTREHWDAAALVRIALCHCQSILCMLPRAQPDWECIARTTLANFEGGLDRLVSEQEARGLPPPSVHDARPIQPPVDKAKPIQPQASAIG